MFIVKLVCLASLKAVLSKAIALFCKRISTSS
ncbi:osiris 9 precursor, partial [Danaus plexippus plexippus]